MEDFFKNLDKKKQDLEKQRERKQAERDYHSALSESFISKLKPLLSPYIQGLEKRGFRVEERDHSHLYAVEIRNSGDGKTASVGVNHAPNSDDQYYIFTDFADYGRQILTITEEFPKERIVQIIENSFQKLI